VATAALFVLPCRAANFVLLAGNRKMAFKSIRWDADKKEYLLQPVSGDAIIPVSQKDVLKLEMDPPAEMEQARQLLAANRNVEAIAPLRAVIANYRGLNWDNTARELLVRVYVKGNEPAKAIQMVDELLAGGGGASLSASLRVEYWRALLALDPKSAKARKDFDAAIATGPREAVPVALVMRGDMRLAAGRKSDALEDYLQAALFFENIREPWAEAVNKAAALLEEGGDAARAAELRQKLNQK